MNTVTLDIENQLIAIATTLYSMNSEVVDIYQYYWGSNAHTLIDGLASGSTPATTGASGSYSKTDIINGITIMDTLQKFFGNQSVTQGGYLGVADSLRNSSTPASVPISNDVENIGARIKIVILNIIQLNKDMANVEKTYNASYLSAIIGGIPASNIIFGSNLAQAKLLAGIVLIQQFQKMLTNQAVTQADYLTTITNLVANS